MVYTTDDVQLLGLWTAIRFLGEVRKIKDPIYHDELLMRTQLLLTAFAVGLEESGVWGIELQDGFELFGAKVLDPGFADFGEGYDSRGLGGGGGGKSRRQDGGEGQKRHGGATRAGE